MCEGEEEEEYRAFVLNTKRKDIQYCTRRTYEQPRAKEREGGGRNQKLCV